MDLLQNTVIVAVGAALLALLGTVFLITRFLRKVPPGKALIIINPLRKSEAEVKFNGGIVIPILHRAEIMDISTKRLTVTRRGKEGLICKDNIRADISVNFYIRVNGHADAVRSVANSIGVERASSPETLDELFSAKFSEALKTVGKKMEFEELFQERDIFRNEIMEMISKSLNGYSLEDTAIDYLEQTPLDSLDPDNVMDSEGIRKITEITLTMLEDKEKRETEAKERILEMEKQREEAMFKKDREVAEIKAREEAQARAVEEEEGLKADQARVRAEEELEVATANKDRQVAVALKNKEKTIAIEEERVTRDKELEITEREKLKELAEYEKLRSVETEKKSIADIIRQRVAVERSVAEEEERTKEIREVSAADRDKKVVLTKAEAEAEQNFVLEIKASEAKERAAKHIAEEKKIQAETELLTAEKIAESKKILADGVIAEEAAQGLAEVKVKEANADAIRVTGRAEADALKDKGFASAEVGKADAEVIDIKSEAEAKRELRMADAEAKRIEQVATAEAVGLKEKFSAEADGQTQLGTAEASAIREKAEATKLYDGVGRDHEEFKIKLATEERLATQRIETEKDIAEQSAKVLSSALTHAKIDIVGGETEFFDKVVGSIGTGKAASGYFRGDGVLREVKEHLLTDGSESPELIKKIKKLVSSVDGGTSAVKNLTVAAALVKLAKMTPEENVLSEIFNLRSDIDKQGIQNKKIDKIIA